jgi:8-oxo-dGTP pyrophosphatase MutT (NUDIX family)
VQPKDPRLDRLAVSLEAAKPRIGLSAAGVPEAAVLLAIRPAESLEVLLIRRTERAGDPWSGHIAFPGGRRAAADPSLAHTALRETEEETGLDLTHAGRILGRLDEMRTSSRLPPLLIAPWVVAAPSVVELRLDPREVVDAAWVPLTALRDPGAISELRFEREGQLFVFPTLTYRDFVIWGLTHRILEQFLDRAADAGV